MRAYALVAAVVTAALYGVRGAHAEAPEPARVAVDWSQVNDADIARCGLTRLRAATIERLVEQGYAVVERVDPALGGIRIAVSSVTAGLHVHVESGSGARDDTLNAGADCDASFVLDAIARIAELTNEVARARPKAGAASSPSGVAPVVRGGATSAQRPIEPAAAVPLQPARADWQAAIDVVVRINEAPDWLLGGGLSARARLPADLELGLRLELTAHAELGVTVLEAFAGPTFAWQPKLRGVGAYLELGPVMHRASNAVLTVTEPDAELAGGVQLSLGHLLAHVLLSARLRSFQHVVGSRSAFDTGHFGIIVRVGAQRFGS